MVLLDDASRHLSRETNPYTPIMPDIYISIRFKLRPSTPHTSKTTGRFVVFFRSHPVSPIMDSFAPEVTVESLIPLFGRASILDTVHIPRLR